MITTSCSGQDSPPDAIPVLSAPATAGTETEPLEIDWGVAGTVAGEGGQPLEITPVGVYYHPGDSKYGKPQNGVFAAVAVKVAATGSSGDHLLPPASGKGFFWQGEGENDGEVLDPTAGNDEPWIGRVSEPNSEQNVQPGKHQNYVITFDVLARGGRLVYESPDGKHVEWKMPARSGGQGLRRVTAALDELGIKR